MNYKVARKTVEFCQLTLEYVLKNVYLPPFQRVENNEHTENILKGIKEYYDEHKEIFLPGTISVGRLPDKPKMILLDGQHRIRALEQFNKQNSNISNELIRIDIYNVQTEEDTYKLYEIINSNKKVALYDGNITPFIIPLVQKFFKEQFPDYCKTSKNPRCPNISLEELGKKLQAYQVIEKIGVTLENVRTRLLEPILSLNAFYSRNTHKFELWGIEEYTAKYKKLMEGSAPFYLGLFRQYEWIDRLIDGKFNESETRAKEIKGRKKIPAPMRMKVWQKEFGDSLKGQCFCCSRELLFNEFECGHVVAVKNGGKDTLENLEAVCRTCNLDMGTCNMMEYKRLFNDS